MNHIKKTKIVCTLGPATCSQESIEALLKEGMNVARFNFSHGDHENHIEHMRTLRAASENTGIPVAILLDTKGPEIRLGNFKNGKAFLQKGQRFTLTTQNVDGDENIASINHPHLPQELKAGNEILLADGLVRLIVESIDENNIHTLVENSAEVSNYKRVAVPGLVLTLPFLSEKDIADIELGIDQGVDIIAASFVQRAKDIEAIQALLKKRNSPAMVIAKIENAQGVQHMEEILAVADGFMVARGDLGVEIAAEKVPLLQKRMIHLCNQVGKPVITATQMLESMTVNPRPTRAEASDVANAILDGTDAVMLSAETTIGKYPIEAVKTMSSIALATEEALNTPLSPGQPSFNNKNAFPTLSTSRAISQSTVQISLELSAAGIITATESGFTAKFVSSYRPQAPIFAVTPNEHVFRQLQLVWGVLPIKGKAHQDSDSMAKDAIQNCLDAGYISKGNVVVVTAGVPIGVSGTTNMIQVHVA